MLLSPNSLDFAASNPGTPRPAERHPRRGRAGSCLPPPWPGRERDPDARPGWAHLVALHSLVAARIAAASLPPPPPPSAGRSEKERSLARGTQPRQPRLTLASPLPGAFPPLPVFSFSLSRSFGGVRMIEPKKASHAVDRGFSEKTSVTPPTRAGKVCLQRSGPARATERG